MLKKHIYRDNVILTPYCAFLWNVHLTGELWDFFYTGPLDSSIVHSMMMF